VGQKAPTININKSHKIEKKCTGPQIVGTVVTFMTFFDNNDPR